MTSLTLPPRHKVFGIGLERTGTTSLTEALRLLGYRALHFPDDDVTRTEIYDHFKSGRKSIHLSILRHYNALTDTPVCCIYRALDKAYPGSKFILTVREKQAWLQSRSRLVKLQILPQFETLPREHPANVYTRFIGDQLYGPFNYDPDRAYDFYNAKASQYFRDRPRDFLTLDICAGEGWSKLAPFLGCPVPAVPFPWENAM